MQFRRDTGLHKPHGERDVLVPEQVDGADVDEGRRETGQILRTSRGGVLVGLAVT